MEGDIVVLIKPLFYKRCSIVKSGELHSAKRLATDFNYDLQCIAKKFLYDGFPRNFIRSTIEYFNKKQDQHINSEWLFNESKLTIITK